MKNQAFMATLCSWLLVCLPTDRSAAGGSPVLGQMSVKGEASINGAAASSGATLFGGDRVATAKDAIAELLLHGGNRVLMPEASSVVLVNDSARMTVNLTGGGLALLSKSDSPAFIDADGARIKPAAGSSVVEVAVRGDSLKVLVHRGSATVETADKTLKVEEGKELDATMAPEQREPGPPGTHAAARGRLETYVFITAVAAGVTGLILGAIAFSRPNAANCKAISPSGTIQCP